MRVRATSAASPWRLSERHARPANLHRTRGHAGPETTPHCSHERAIRVGDLSFAPKDIRRVHIGQVAHACEVERQLTRVGQALREGGGDR